MSVDYVQKLYGFLRVCGECIDDLRLYRKGVPIHYNIDFSLLCPILFNFDRAPPGSKDFLISEKDSMRRVLGKRPGDGHYGLVISGPTILEFFDQLDHTLRDIETRIPALHRQFREKDMQNETVLRNALATSKEIKRDLSLLTEQGLDARLRTPINRLISLLDEHKLSGIGDVLDAKAVRANTDKHLFDQFLAEQNSKRSDARFHEDRRFHFMIDATNNCLTVAASHLPGIRTPFVTTTPLNIKQCTVNGEAFGRLARTPLFLLNLHRLKLNHEIGDEIDFLKSAAREAAELVEDMQAFKSFDDYPGGIKVRLARFYAGPIAMLDKGSTSDDNGPEDKQLEEIVKNLSDEGRLQNILKDAVNNAKEGAKLIEMHPARFDLPYLDEFNFSDDPVVARIKKDLGISLKQ